MMTSWTSQKAVAHPEWILDALSSLSRTSALYAKGLIPGSIEAPMIVVPIKRVLRGVYGSDLRAALALLRMALAGVRREMGNCMRDFWQFKVLRKDREAYYDAQIAALAREDDE